MNDRSPSSALRELRGHLAEPQVAAAIGGIGVILGIAGPFGTDALLRLGPRIVYWIILAAVTYGIGFLVSVSLGATLRARGVPTWLRVVGDGIVTGTLITLAVAGINWTAFGYTPDTLAEWAGFAVMMVAIATIISGIGAVAHGRGPADAAPEAAPPPILARLPFEKRGTLLSLSAEDHYVRVRTATGDELILMRLADAIAETAPTEGLQVHRSHWVARSAIAAVRRQGDRAILTLSSGDEIPASRANVATLREEGFL